MTDEQAWRPLIAVLANPQTRTVAARLMLGGDLAAAVEGLSPSRREKTVRALRTSGLLDADDRFHGDAFREALAAHAVPRRQGVQRFLDGSRITHLPATPADRRELLAWVAERALDPAEVVDERTLTERLLEFTDDTAGLRRALVDHEFVERRADGSEYVRVGGR